MTQPDLPRAEIERQLERLLESPQFRGARQLSAFLRHVVERTLAGQSGTLKESTIGVEVFGRGPDFDPKADGAVRVQAVLLRKKLAAFYAEEGKADPILIEVPKGGYIPTFRAVTSVESTPPAETAAPPRPRWGLIAGGAVLLVAVALWLLVRGAGGPVASDRPGQLWAPFFEGDAPTVLAFGTPLFFSAGPVMLRDVEVNSPDAAASAERLRAIEHALGRPLVPTEIYTGIGETNGAVLLAQHFARHGRELRVLRSRHLGWEDLKDAHVVMLSSMRFHTLMDQLGIRSDFVFSRDPHDGAVQNLRPAAGEPPRYEGKAGLEYVLLTASPGKTPGRHVLWLQGRTTWGTQAAAEYVTRPEHLRALEQQLESCRARRRLDRHPASFQVLLRAEVADAQPIGVTYVTHHDL